MPHLHKALTLAATYFHMRVPIFIVILFSHFAVIGQIPVSEQNRISLDSLIQSLRTSTNCMMTASNLKNVKRKRKVDIKLSNFLNDFYFQRLDETSINLELKETFNQQSWGFYDIKQNDSLIRYQGRIRSFGNLEAFIGYIVADKRIVGRRIYFRVRSKLDCIQEHDGGVPDLLYLANFIPKHFEFKLDLSQWNPFFHSDIWIDPNLDSYVSTKVRALLDKSTSK